MKISYEDLETWRLAFDRLRITPDWYKKPRYDWVLFRGSGDERGEYHFGQLNSVFTCNVGSTIYPLALVTIYDIVYSPRSRVDHDLGLVRIRARQNKYAGSAFIHLGTIIRGALVIQDPGLPATFEYKGTRKEENAYGRLQRLYGIDKQSMAAFWAAFYQPGLEVPAFNDRRVIDLVDSDMFLRMRKYFNYDT